MTQIKSRDLGDRPRTVHPRFEISPYLVENVDKVGNDKVDNVQCYMKVTLKLN